ncbi:SMP-30/gluconolactonase/LRE family protein [Prosthecobacter sp. SYSU 5D2]|uniref:SMP-30/gluconolactonase/LRE family protein n=1 Tax=Prosthecobacter sp. SYSU 5D2 TaxID=3134134 RepID=UPI0031FF207E
MKYIFLLLLLSLTATLAADPAPEFKGGIERLDPAFDKLIAPDSKVEVLATGFNWSEGPVWKDGQILFSDVPENTVFAWKEGDTSAATFLKPSGSLSGNGQGSNGLAVDAAGSLILCQHGERRIARLEKDGSFTSLADKYEGKRFNSPNDLVIAKSGAIFFTDPPYGMKKGTEPDAPYHGVYRLDKDGHVSLIIEDILWPNGIALSPDEKTLYIAVSDKDNARLMAYDLQADGSVKNGRLFFHAQPLKSEARKGGCDGMKVDVKGNIWTTGPGGVLVISPEGKHLGSILTGVPTGNCAWGGPEKDTMYVTADMFLLRVKTLVKGY